MEHDPSEIRVNPRPLPDWSMYTVHLTRHQIDEVLHHAHIIPMSHGFTGRLFATKYPGWDLNSFISVFQAAGIHLRDIGHSGRCHWQVKRLHFDSVESFDVEWDEAVVADDGRRHAVAGSPR